MNDEDLDKSDDKLNGRMMPPNLRYLGNNITQKQETLQANFLIRTISDYFCHMDMKRCNKNSSPNSSNSRI